MRQNKTHSVPESIGNIHQLHVRPIVRGKEKTKVEFGSKINVSLVVGYSFLDHLSWEAFNEGSHLMESVEIHEASWILTTGGFGGQHLLHSR